ncbi:hypothetical protein Pse7367_2345 [Thalassoporum mexicanum PCC 7367]|nr:hypothetical protein Pse7367_2345 [Pseudanabaena sp. PCC 7367]
MAMMSDNIKIKLFCANIKKSSFLYTNQDLMRFMHDLNPFLALINWQRCFQADDRSLEFDRKLLRLNFR